MGYRVIDFHTQDDLDRAVDQLNDSDFNGSVVSLREDPRGAPLPRGPPPSRYRGRGRGPPPRRRDDDFRYRPRRDDYYRRRSRSRSRSRGRRSRSANGYYDQSPPRYRSPPRHRDDRTPPPPRYRDDRTPPPPPADYYDARPESQDIPPE